MLSTWPTPSSFLVNSKKPKNSTMHLTRGCLVIGILKYGVITPNLPQPMSENSVKISSFLKQTVKKRIMKTYFSYVGSDKVGNPSSLPSLHQTLLNILARGVRI